MIFVDESIPLLAELLAPLGEVYRFRPQALDRALLIQMNCRALFFRSSLRVTPALLEGTTVEFLGSVTSGSDHIAESLFRSDRYTIALAQGANANAVAEYVLASILEWSYRMNISPAGISIGIIGFGNIGRRVAEYCHQLGMQVIVSDPPLQDQGFLFPSYVTTGTLAQLLDASTIITAHVPLILSGPYRTTRLLTTSMLAGTPVKLLINTSRGQVIPNRVLLDATRRGVAVSIDVWENEPNISPTVARRAIFATCHIAGHSINAKLAASVQVARQYYAFCKHPFTLPLLNLPPRILFEQSLPLDQVRKVLLRSRQFDRDSAALRRFSRLPVHKRIPAIEHFRVTYPPRFETYRTHYDSD
ncbi:MAG: hypothetical protein NZ606_02135 [Candidatus Kapabacteria bacterium]|nr:hypothetical protein [Candidatus Kapabacteria bacterium]